MMITARDLFRALKYRSLFALPVALACSDSPGIFNYPPNEPPTVVITGASPWIAGVPVTFVAAGHDSDGYIVRYEWDWQNDGAIDYTGGSSPKHTFAAGDYTTRVRVTDDRGAQGAATIALAIVEAPSSGIYVSTTGLDYNDGTAGSPVATLETAYALARSSGKNEILVEEGLYPDHVEFVAGISVLGGRTLPTWAEGMGYSIFRWGVADDITTTTRIRRVELHAFEGPSANTIALQSARSSAALRFEECRFISTDATPGSDGEPTFPWRDSDGGDGGIGYSLADHIAVGGNGGESPYGGCRGGMGAGEVSPATAGSCNGGKSGANGSGDVDGEDGESGTPGTPGNQGVPADPAGEIHGDRWYRLVSTNGTQGTYGSGGGGGGAYNTSLWGGGGGGGGRGGHVGLGGSGGFGSFAVMLFASSPDFDACYFETGQGGNGGRGSDGHPGGKGGKGGPGASMPPEISTHRAGNGGDGGDGGPGGGGAGGPGGPSVGVCKIAGSAPIITSPVFVIGNPGIGGAGGLNGAGVPAPSGANGFSAETKAYEVTTR
jgi:hypothetical protein